MAQVLNAPADDQIFVDFEDGTHPAGVGAEAWVSQETVDDRGEALVGNVNESDRATRVPKLAPPGEKVAVEGEESDVTAASKANGNQTVIRAFIQKSKPI